MDQIIQYAPPPNPAKDTDARFEKYREEHGDESWELDALDPEVIAGLIREAVDGVRDDTAWQEALEEEALHRGLLDKCAEEWDGVVSFLNDEY